MTLNFKPPREVKTPPRKIRLPPRPLFSPTSGEPMPVPDYNIAPEQLGVPWVEDEEEIPEFERIRPADYVHRKTTAELEERNRQARTDIFERCGDPYTASVDTAPRRPQYFPPGTDVATDSPPLSLGAVREHEIPDIFYDRNRAGMSQQSNICVGAKRREKFLKRQKWPVYQLSPIADEPYLEYLGDKLAEHEYKGPFPEAKGLSPWRNEEVYYTPTEGDSTLEDLDWPLASPPRTPPYQGPYERPCGYKSPIVPGISSPRTPPMQRPEERPLQFKSPFVPGVTSPLTPPWQYPPPRREDYESPLGPGEGLSPLPMDAFWDPMDYVGMGLSDVEGLEDDVLPVESPEPCTPCGDRDMPTPSMRTPTGPAPPERKWVPLGPDGRPLVAKRLFTGEESPEVIPSSRLPPSRLPARGQIPSRIPSRGQIPSKIPSRGQIPSKIPSRGQIPSKIPSRGQIPSRIPSIGQASSRLPQPGLQRPSSRAGSPPPQRQMPEPDPYLGTPEARTPVPQRGLRQPAMGTPTRRLMDRPKRRLFEGEDMDRPKRRLFEGEDGGSGATCGVCGEAEPSVRRSPKNVTPPPWQPPPAASPWSTPVGEQGPSRRPTGLSPEGYNSDFDDPPPQQAPGSPKFAPARRIKKRGGQLPEYPVERIPKYVSPPPYQPAPERPPYLTPRGEPGPSRRPTGLTPEGYDSDFEDPPPQQAPGSPRFPPARRIKKRGRIPQTPTDPRRIPSPCMRPSRAPRLLSRTLGDPGERSQRPQEEPPVMFSPMEPFVPDVDTWISPPPPPPKYYKAPMYFPTAVMDTSLPNEYPTTNDLMKHNRCRDTAGRFHSRLKGVGVGPGPYVYRDSREPLFKKAEKVSPSRRIIHQPIPEYEDNVAWRSELMDRTDVDVWDYIDKPPDQQQQRTRPMRCSEFPRRPRSPMATKDPEPRRDPYELEELDISEPSGYEDYFNEILAANLRVPPEQYPPPMWERKAPAPPKEPPPFAERFGIKTCLARSKEFLDAQQQGNLSQYLGQRQFEDIAEQADMLFDTAGGLLDQTPPEQVGRNYYPDIMQAVSRLGRAVENYDLPESPLPSPFLLSPGTPPGLPPQWSPASVPSGSPRTPPPRRISPPSGGTCGTGPCGKGGEVAQRPSKRLIPPKPKQLKETKSSQLRKQQQAKKAEVKLSPTSRMMKKRKEKAAKAAEDKKRQAAAKRQAEEEAKRAESMARVAEGLPGGKMRPLDYRTARGTGRAPLSSAKKGPTQELEDHEGAKACRNLFGQQVPAGGAEAEGVPRGLTGRKRKGRKGPGAPGGVFRRRDSEDDLAVPLTQRGPEFMEELRQHNVQFPRRREGVVLGGGKYKRVPRRSEEAVNLLEEIGEEAGSPCAPCGEEEEDGDDYQATLRELGITEEEAAAAFDTGFLDELDEDQEDAQGSPNAIQELESQLREMDAYERQQADFWRDMAADLTEEEIRELGISRAELEGPGPCGPCGVGGSGPSTRAPERRQLTQEQQQMLAQLQQLEERADQLADEPQRSPELSEFDLVEQAVIQREQEEREYFERMMGRGPEAQSPGGSPMRSPARSPVRTPQQRILTEEEEQMEFEELERQMDMEGQGRQVCQGARSPRALPQLDEVALQQESMMRQRLLQQQLQTQGPRIRGRPFPASGISYSPPRPQGAFGPPPYQQSAGRLPISTPPRPVSPPRQPTPPLRTPPRPPSPEIPAAPSPPPSPPGVLEETPPYIGDMDDEDRLLASPCRPRPPPLPRWTPSPPPPRIPSPPPFIPTPPSPPLLAQDVREQIASMARPEFDPARRRDVLQRDERRAFKAPSIGLYNVQEDEPLIPELAGDESFMGWPVIPGERAPKKRRRYYKDKKAKRLFGKSEISKMCRKIEKQFDLPPLPPESSPQEDYLLDDSIPDDLPRPIAPQWQQISPIRRLPLEPVELAPWEGVGYRQPGPCQPRQPELEMPIHSEIYQGGGQVHPDLADLVGYEPPMVVPEDMEDLGEMDMGEEMCFTPERYPEIDERELDREAALAYQPPPLMKNIWLSSPQELGVFTPPSIGKGPCGTYTPTATPPLQLLESPVIGGLVDDFMAPDMNVPGPAMEEFMERTPPLEQITSIQEMKYYTYHAKGREGIKPKPMNFGGYGETPRRPIPRWYGRGGQRNVIREVEEPVSPPTPGTPPPQFPAPLSYYSPELDEFQLLEQQMQEEESKTCRRSRKREKRRELEARQREMMINELTEQAERREMETRMAPRRPPSPPRAPSPQRMPSPPRVPTPPRSPGSPCGPPPIDNRALEQFMLQEMDFDPNAAPLTPPGTPDLMDQGMYDIFEGMESPPPLSPQAGPCMPCTPPAPPSPPPPPPDSPPRPQWQIYAEQMEREARARQEREERRQQLYQRNIDEIQQMFGPSPGPPSPGPDADFYANIYAHQVPAGFRQGDRPRTAIRDQIGKREVIMRLPRHTPAPGLASSVITEPRVRTTQQPSRGRPAPRPRTAPVAATKPTLPPQVEQKSSAQRIAEARKHYQNMGRLKKIGAPRGGQRAGPSRAQPQPQTQLNLQPVEDFLRRPDQQQDIPAAPCAAMPKITPEEAQRRARERLRARKMQEQTGLRGRVPQAAPPPPPQPFTGFLPTQVQRQMPRLPQPVQSIDEFVRGGPRSRAGPASRSGPQQRVQPSTSGTQVRRQPSAGGGCGGGSGRGCGGGRQKPPSGGSGGGCCGGRK